MDDGEILYPGNGDSWPWEEDLGRVFFLNMTPIDYTMPRPRHPAKEIKTADQLVTGLKTEFEFVFVLSGSIEDYDRLEHDLFKAGCDDATLSLQCGRIYLAFSREANSYDEAIVSAAADVAKAGGRIDAVDATFPV